MHWLYLCVAIIAEIIATSTLKATEGFTHLMPSAVAIIGYAVAFYFLSISLKIIPVGIAYAVWSGAGILLLALVGWIIYKQALDLAGIIGMVLIIAGIVVLNLFSKIVPH